MGPLKGRRRDLSLDWRRLRGWTPKGVVVDQRPVPLTNNEIAVTAAAAHGLTLEQAAAELGVSVESATLFRHWAMRKAGVSNPAALVATALANGGISVPSALIIVQPETGQRARRGTIQAQRQVSVHGPDRQLDMEQHQVRCPLTERQLQTIRGLAIGLAISQIAGVLELSEITVRNHIQRARARLDAPNRVSVAVAAISDGCIPPPPEHLRMGQPGLGADAVSQSQRAYVVEAETQPSYG